MDGKKALNIEKVERNEKNDGKTPAKKRFAKWLMAGVTAVALSCGVNDSNYIPPIPAAGVDAGTVSDGGADGSTTTDGGSSDGGTITDSGTTVDGGPDADGGTVTDGGVDADGGPITDGGPDADGGTVTDGGVDGEGGFETCLGLYNDTDYGALLSTGVAHETGGYDFTYQGETSTGVIVDINCAGSGITGLAVDFGTTEVIDDTENGKRINITHHTSSAYSASLTIIVEDIPGGVDGGTTDGGVDGGISTVCSSVSNGVTYGTYMNTGIPLTIGGYIFTNNGESGTGITMNVTCGADSASVASGLYCEEGGPETVFEVPGDSKRIRLLNHTSSPYGASVTIVVENL